MPKGRIFVVGSAITDLTFYCNEFPKPGETVKGEFESGLGGKGFNQAVAAKLAGAEEVHFIGALGADTYGCKFLDKLSELDIHAHITSCPGTTGAASILVNAKGENQITVSLGANKSLYSEIVYETLQTLNAGSESTDILLLQLETNKEAVYAALDNFKNGIKILNPAPYNLGDFDLNWLKKVDILTPNETEALNLKAETGINFQSPIDLKSNLPTLQYIETRGKDGVLWVNHPYSQSLEYGVLPINAVVDTSGAGDAFNGALAAGLLERDFKLDQAIPFAIAAAGLSVTKKGTSKSFAAEEEIATALATRNISRKFI